MPQLLHTNPNAGTRIELTAQAAGWQYLSFRVLALNAGEFSTYRTDNTEVALVPLSGEATVSVAGDTFALARRSVFAGRPHVLYVPPGHSLRVDAESAFEFSLGSAPAEGRFPVRLFKPEEMREEIRGGGPALRQVNHVLAAPLPAERLILFEVYVPGGQWAGWPPHCHDGYSGSPYLEEIYYYRFSSPRGFGLQHNYRRDTEFEKVILVRHGDLVQIAQGFHPTVASPGSNMYFLNYLAGELLDEARAKPPLDDADYAWMKQDWEGGRWSLPIGQD
jgi:5-deoxy-glucuronate isomerase